MNRKSDFTTSLHGGSKPWVTMRNSSKTPPVYESSVFVFESLADAGEYLAGDEGLYMYSRLGNPNLRQLEQRLAALEGADEGVVFSSGMAAIHGALMGAAAYRGLRADNCRILAASSMYGGTRALLEGDLVPLGFTLHEVDVTDIAAVEAALAEGADIFYFETISNPTMQVADLPVLAGLARKYGALSIVDNTFASPALLKPLEYGIDLVVHSSTKYINGHSDVTGGVALGAADLMPLVRRKMVNMGAMASPHDAWLTLRGLQTLAMRMERHSRNAELVAARLAQLPGVSALQYPLLPDNPRIERNRMLFPHGCGGMVSFDLENESRVDRFIRALKLAVFAPSLAGLQTSVSHPASTSHRGQSDAQLASQGISRGSVRLSVGLEDPEDIVQDLARALQASQE